MTAFRYDPYLWLHLAGVATVPLWLDLCLLGLAVDYPTWPTLERVVITAIGVLPVLWMQLRKPFYIFSLPLLTLKPSALTLDQRQLLTLFHQGWVRALAVLVPLPLLWGLGQINTLTVLAADITPFAGWGRLGGVAIASLGFLLANLFLQVPVAVLLVMATANQRFPEVSPYPVEAITADFTYFPGLQLGQILPTVHPPTENVAADLEDVAATATPLTADQSHDMPHPWLTSLEAGAPNDTSAVATPPRVTSPSVDQTPQKKPTVLENQDLEGLGSHPTEANAVDVSISRGRPKR
ncbi:low-complexity tail membrane protein [Nodosilinea sp. P-1105]|uniref:low-complexity tail membrane protein n=1 Tax=Nodosilinea sp. P-1105 TaxID=2546229 RepID=UPI00146C24B9|nr:low-complexity tail membrane protein [Nodosilinea sp. P-1105]NMF85776.1 low-complexity tail membrane protein [Nodosilinea sp. P-1105]